MRKEIKSNHRSCQVEIISIRKFGFCFVSESRLSLWYYKIWNFKILELIIRNNNIIITYKTLSLRRSKMMYVEYIQDQFILFIYQLRTIVAKAQTSNPKQI